MGGYNKFKGDFFLFMIYFKLAFLFSIFASLPFPPIFLSVFQVLVVISFVNGLPMVGCEVEASGVLYISFTFMFSSLDMQSDAGWEVLDLMMCIDEMVLLLVFQVAELSQSAVPDIACYVTVRAWQTAMMFLRIHFIEIPEGGRRIGLWPFPCL